MHAARDVFFPPLSFNPRFLRRTSVSQHVPPTQPGGREELATSRGGTDELAGGQLHPRSMVSRRPPLASRPSPPRCASIHGLWRDRRLSTCPLGRRTGGRGGAQRRLGGIPPQDNAIQRPPNGGVAACYGRLVPEPPAGEHWRPLERLIPRQRSCPGRPVREETWSTVGVSCHRALIH